MEKGKKMFWRSFAVCGFFLICVAAVLFAETPKMSSSSFISFSPWLDAVLYGAAMVIPGSVMVFWVVQGNMAIRVRESLRFPAAYFLTVLILTVAVLVLGMFGQLSWTNPTHMPIYHYAALMAVCYVLCGFLWGRFYGGSVKGALISAAVLLGVLGLLAWLRLEEIVREIKTTLAWVGSNVTFPYTDWVMDSWQGQIMAWLNLPACVILGSYSYAHLDIIGIDHGISRETMTWLVTLVPVCLFTASWLLGRCMKKQHMVCIAPDQAL